MDNLPLKYVPSCLLKKPPISREVMYGIGIEYEYNEFGMTDGPSSELYIMLEIAPGEDKSCVIRFNEDGTDDVLYRWKNDSWVRQPILKRK
jgi:hypothetical protein